MKALKELKDRALAKVNGGGVGDLDGKMHQALSSKPRPKPPIPGVGDLTSRIAAFNI